jgi:hypothetical protein
MYGIYSPNQSWRDDGAWQRILDALNPPDDRRDTPDQGLL